MKIELLKPPIPTGFLPILKVGDVLETSEMDGQAAIAEGWAKAIAETDPRQPVSRFVRE